MEYANNDKVSNKHQKELPRIKKCVESAHKYFKHNYERFNHFRKFVFETSLDDKIREVNKAKDWPVAEFNTTNAYISRLCGEFSKQEPSIEVMANDGDEIDPQVIETVEGHFRHLLDDAEQDGTQYQTYRDVLGGFSVLEVSTDYANKMSFNQVIKLRKSKYVTMCGFDPMAMSPHKGDGRFNFKIYPKRKEEFKQENPKIDIEDLKFTKELDGFSWSFSNGHEDILLICEFYEKKNKKTKIMQLVDGTVVTEQDYKELLSKWDKVEQPPGVVGKPRMTNLETICRYTFIENQIIQYDKTDFNNLPLVFADGDSIDLYESDNGTMKQFIRPYIYHAEGAQHLKNLATQSLMNNIENQVAHKFIVKKEAIPLEKEYRNALTNIQKASTLVVNAFVDNEPNNPIPNPIEPVPLVPCPPEVISGISLADQIMQTVLGSYDASLGINNNQLSGVAIVEGATQSNAAAMPYVVNYLQALNQVANIVLDLIPKYYKTPRTIPIMKKNGERSFVKINQEGGVDLNYDSNALQVKVKPGVNFAIQKSRALQQITSMMQASEAFAHFMNAKGLQILIDNFEIRGADILKELAKEYEKEMQQQQQQQQQMAQQAQKNDPRLLKVQNERMKIMQDGKQNEISNQIKLEELQAKKEANAINAAVMIDKAEAEKLRAHADLSIKATDMKHAHAKEHREMLHNIDMDHKNHELSKSKASESKV